MLRILSFIFAIMLSLSGCAKKDAEQPKATIVPVTAYQVPQPKDHKVELVYPGKTKSISFVTV